MNVGRQGRTGNLWTLHCKSLNCPKERKSVFKKYTVQHHLCLLQQTLEGAFPHELVYLSKKKKKKFLVFYNTEKYHCL